MIETIISILQILGTFWVCMAVIFLAWIIVVVVDENKKTKKKYEDQCDKCEMWAGCLGYKKGEKCEILEENYD